MIKTAIYGPGGFGREVVPYTSYGCFISDDPAQVGANVLGAKVYSLDDLARLDRMQAEAHERAPKPEYDRPQPYSPIGVVIAVAGADVRRRLADAVLAAGLREGRLTASTAFVGPGVDLGRGAILCHQSIITASATIGRQFHANIYSYVAHDCVIGDFVTLAPRASINGNTVIEDDVYVGTGAILRQGTPEKPLRIGKGAVIGMGAVVTKDVAAGETVVGNPARPMDIQAPRRRSGP